MSSQDDQASLDQDLAAAFDDAEGVEATAEPVAEPEPELEPLEPPHMWGKEYKDTFNEWGNLENGRAYQEAMTKLYGETQAHVTKKEQEAAAYRREVDQWNSMFQPYANEFRMRGITPHAVTNQMLGYYQALQSDPAQAIQRLAKEHGVDLEKMVQEQPYIPPEVAAMQKQLEQMQAAQQQREQYAAQAEQHQALQRIETFAKATDASGQPLRPHFDQVIDQMTGLIQAFKYQHGSVPNDDQLQTIYENACKLDEDISAQVAAKAEAEEAARKSAEAKKAKSAAKRPQGKQTGHGGESKSLKDDLSAAWDEQVA